MHPCFHKTGRTFPKVLLFTTSPYFTTNFYLLPTLYLTPHCYTRYSLPVTCYLKNFCGVLIGSRVRKPLAASACLLPLSLYREKEQRRQGNEACNIYDFLCRGSAPCGGEEWLSAEPTARFSFMRIDQWDSQMKWLRHFCGSKDASTTTASGFRVPTSPKFE